MGTREDTRGYTGIHIAKFLNEFLHTCDEVLNCSNEGFSIPWSNKVGFYL